jgi:hypothetical protein
MIGGLFHQAALALRQGDRIVAEHADGSRHAGGW